MNPLTLIVNTTSQAVTIQDCKLIERDAAVLINRLAFRFEILTREAKRLHDARRFDEAQQLVKEIYNDIDAIKLAINKD